VKESCLDVTYNDMRKFWGMQRWIVLSGSVVVTARHALGLRVELTACSYGGRTAANVLKSKRWTVAMVRELIASRNVMQDLKCAIFERDSEIWGSVKGEIFCEKVTKWYLVQALYRIDKVVASIPT